MLHYHSDFGAIMLPTKIAVLLVVAIIGTSYAAQKDKGRRIDPYAAVQSLPVQKDDNQNQETTDLTDSMSIRRSDNQNQVTARISSDQNDGNQNQDTTNLLSIRRSGNQNQVTAGLLSVQKYGNQNQDSINSLSGNRSGNQNPVAANPSSNPSSYYPNLLNDKLSSDQGQESILSKVLRHPESVNIQTGNTYMTDGKPSNVFGFVNQDPHKVYISTDNQAQSQLFDESRVQERLAQESINARKLGSLQTKVNDFSRKIESLRVKNMYFKQSMDQMDGYLDRITYMIDTLVKQND